MILHAHSSDPCTDYKKFNQTKNKKFDPVLHEHELTKASFRKALRKVPHSSCAKS